MSRHPHTRAFSVRCASANASQMPEILYIDASAILESAWHRRYGEAVDDFLSELVHSGGMVTWSTLTEHEVRQVVHVNAYAALAEKSGISGRGNVAAWKAAENSASLADSRNIARSVLTITDQIFYDLGANYGLPLDPGDPVFQQHIARYLYVEYGGGFNDALHLAIANEAGVNSILVQDARFMTYPYLNVFGASREIHRQRESGNQLVPWVDYSSLANMGEKD